MGGWITIPISEGEKTCSTYWHCIKMIGMDVNDKVHYKNEMDILNDKADS